MLQSSDDIEKMALPIKTADSLKHLKPLGYAQLIQLSGLFDEDYYVSQARGRIGSRAPIIDYLKRGESSGLWPNSDFDPTFYNQTYPAFPNDSKSALVRHLMSYDAQRPTTHQSLLMRIAELESLAGISALTQPLRVSYCIPVKQRLADLKATLPTNLAEHRRLTGKVEFIVMDFDASKLTTRWIEKRFPKDLRRGLLRVISSSEVPDWHFGRAKNAFAPHIRGLMVSSLDADNFVTRAQSMCLMDVAKATAGFALVHHFSGKNGDGTSGRLSMPASVYRLTGYDNCLLPRQFDEMAAILRALTQFPFLPFYSPVGSKNVFDGQGAMVEFREAERLPNARREIALPSCTPPLNPRGDGYAQANPELRWSGIFNAAQSRFELAKHDSFRASMKEKAAWAASHLSQEVSTERLCMALFGTVPSSQAGPTAIALYNESPDFLHRFCMHHLALGISRIILIVPPQLNLEKFPSLPEAVEILRPRVGIPDTAAPLWLEMALRAAIHLGDWGIFAESTTLLCLPKRYSCLEDLISELDAKEIDWAYALRATVLEESKSKVPAVFQARGPSLDCYAEHPSVTKNFAKNFRIPWRYDASYHLFGTVRPVRKLVMMRNRQGLRFTNIRNEIEMIDSARNHPAWRPRDPRFILYDHGLRLNGPTKWFYEREA